jgi:hypothetical protein
MKARLPVPTDRIALGVSVSLAGFRNRTVSHQRPFVDTFISKTTRLYADTRTAQTNALAHGSTEVQPGSSNLDKMNAELQDVTRIMTKNMEDLLWRGDSLDRESDWKGESL